MKLNYFFIFEVLYDVLTHQILLFEVTQVGQWGGVFPCRPTVCIESHVLIIPAITEDFACGDVHQMHLFFFGEGFVAQFPQLPNADEE